MLTAIFIVLVAVALALAYAVFHKTQLAALEARFEARLTELETDADNLWARSFPSSAPATGGRSAQYVPDPATGGQTSTVAPSDPNLTASGNAAAQVQS